MDLSKTPLLIFRALGEYINEFFFGLDQKGNEVFPLIDRYFIKSFCEHNKLSDSDFIRLVQRKNIWDISGSSQKMEVLGFIGFQLYAASEMENSSIYSSSNFSGRICDAQMLNIDTNNWQRWVKDNQDDLWKSYYLWCINNGYIISNKCSVKTGKDRYVQYPKVHSKMILNREDLKRIAAIFVEKKLSPHEDISEYDFWSIIGRNHNKSYYSLRSSNILLENRELANKQIFQFYQTWNGEYKDWNTDKKAALNTYQLSLLQNENKWILDINLLESNKIIKSLDLSSIDLQREIKGFYNFRRDDIILFKKDDYYNDYWVETRYLESIEDEGIVILFNKSWSQLYSDSDVINRYLKFVIVRVNTSNRFYKQFYTQNRGFSIKGGMKIGTNTYLLGAPPLLEFKQKMDFWVDGEKYDAEVSIFRFNFLEGPHQIKIKGYKNIELKIIKPIPSFLDWGNNPKWVLSRKESVDWSSHAFDGDVCGFDFEKYSTIGNNKYINNGIGPLTDWCHKIVFQPLNYNSLKNLLLKSWTK